MANEKKSGGVNPVAVGLAGAVVGAAAAAGAIVLADEKNRKKLEKVLGDLKKEGFKVLEVVQNEANVVRKLTGGSNGKSSPKSSSKSKAKKGK
jgi:hypothetical protein